MKKDGTLKLYLLFLMGLLFSAGVSGQLRDNIKSSVNKYVYSYQQVPDNLISDGNALPNGTTFVWESSLNYSDNFVAIGGTNGTQEVLSFNTPLTQTTYFRRIATLFSGGVFGVFSISSNIIKIQVVSVNWENINYVREHDVLVPNIQTWQAVDQLPIGQKLQTTTYMDGLGRPIQKVSKETATPDQPDNLWGDVVQFSNYDALGRQPLQYLPYTTLTDPGKIKTDALMAQPAYYNTNYNETSAYNNTTYDNSPLNRVVNVKSAGTSWANSNGNTTSYDLNELDENVQNFSIGYNTGDIPVNHGHYPANTLFKNIHTDETGKKVIEYTNNTGQLILVKVQVDNSPSIAHSGWICTYSIYDEMGLLRYRIQPEGVKWLDEHAWSFAGSDGQQVLYEMCFRYEYDEKGRNILKKAPGAKELLMIYDQRDRLVFMQDGNQRLKSPAEWTANLYDEFDRPIITTLYRTNKTVSQLQADIANANNTSTTTINNPASPLNDLVVNNRQPGVTLYTAQSSIEFVAGFESAVNDVFTAEINPSATTAPITVNTVTYKPPINNTDLNNPAVNTIVKYYFYDNYSYSTVRSFNNNFDNGLAYTTGEPIVPTKRTLNSVTGTMVRVLGKNTFLTSTSYYDEKGRAIQILKENIMSGWDIATVQYDFDGRILSTNSKHASANSGYDDYSIISKNLFDKIGRITAIEKKYGSNDFKRIAAYVYDDIGRIKTKRFDPGYTASGKNELESLAYSFNIHNKIMGINQDYALKTPGKYNKWGNFFGFYLGYDNRDGAFANPLLNGQVTGVLWTTQGDDAQRKYDFTYDNATRLVSALFNERQNPASAWSNAKMNFSVTGATGKINYDLNGNILSMLQKGVVPGTATPVNVDDLQYAYANLSNKLLRVTDNNNLGTVNGKLGDFSDGVNGGTDDYSYDDNRNLITDLNKNATDLGGVVGARGISYNFLDKSEEIHIKDKGTIKLVYDADGNKLQKIFTPDGGSGTTTTYINEFIYKDNSLQYINFEEGRIRVVQPTNQNNGYDILMLDGNMDLPGGKRGAYDFFVKDYQENVRMILTEETHLGSNSCTMETGRSANEEPLFGQIDARGVPTADNEVKARFAISGIPGQSSGNGWQNSAIGNYVSRIGNLAGKKVGPNTLLKVMAGDQISTTTIYYYQNPVVNQSGSSALIPNLLLSLAQAISGGGAVSELAKGAASNISSLLNSSVPFTAAIAPDAASATGNNPKAYLSVLFFDERFNFVGEGSATARVTQAGNGASPLVLANIKAPKNGYAYVYVSNESNEMVYFDNLQVSNNYKHIIEENHYYAYGLKIAGISSRKMPDPAEGYIDNKNLYNDKELIDDADLDWYDYGFRNYDPQIGRFPQLDPLTDSYPFYTPYQYAGGEPIANVDMDGLEPLGVLGSVSQGAGSFTILGEKAGKTMEFLGNMGAASSSWSTTMEGVTVSAKLSSKVASTSLAPVLSIAGKAALQAMNVADNLRISQPDIPNANSEQRAKISVSMHDAMDPSHPLIMGTYQVGARDQLLGNQKNGFAWAWRTQAIQEDNDFWMMMMPLPKFMAMAREIKAGSIAAEGGSRAFFSGAGTEARAIKEGLQTLGQTRAGQNLQNLIDSKNIPWEGVGGAESMWKRLSATWAKGIPNGSSVPVFLNNPRAGSIWLKTELPILKSKGVNLIYK